MNFLSNKGDLSFTVSLLGSGLSGLIKSTSGRPSTVSMPACLSLAINCLRRAVGTQIAVNERFGILDIARISELVTFTVKGEVQGIEGTVENVSGTGLPKSEPV